MAKRSISVAQLREDCRTLERAVIQGGLASRVELEPHRPGGTENSDKGATGWLRFFAVLHRRHSRGEDTRRGDAHSKADAITLGALGDKPIPVHLVTPVMDGERVVDVLHVYAKSLDAYLRAHALEHSIAWLLDAKSTIEAGSGESELLTRIADALGYTYGVLVWIMVSPGPNTPYDSDNLEPEPPAYLRALDPWDVIAVCRAMQQHHARLTAVRALSDHKTQNEDGGLRPSWSMFVGVLALETGEDPVVLMRHRSLMSLLSARSLDNAAKAYALDPGRKQTDSVGA